MCKLLALHINLWSSFSKKVYFPNKFSGLKEKRKKENENLSSNSKKRKEKRKNKINCTIGCAN